MLLFANASFRVSSSVSSHFAVSHFAVKWVRVRVRVRDRDRVSLKIRRSGKRRSGV